MNVVQNKLLHAAKTQQGGPLKFTWHKIWCEWKKKWSTFLPRKNAASEAKYVVLHLDHLTQNDGLSEDEVLQCKKF